MLLFLLPTVLAAQEYDQTMRHNDSVLIYNSYKSTLDYLKNMKQTDIQKWHAMEAEADRITACAKLRLKKYNGTAYKPVKVFERSGYGEAQTYPMPSTITMATPDAFCKETSTKFRYVVYDKQTRFLSLKGSCVKIPYILKMVFNKGRMIFSEMLNPLTYEKLVVSNPTLN